MSWRISHWLNDDYSVLFYLGTGSHCVALADLEITVETALSSNSAFAGSGTSVDSLLSHPNDKNCDLDFEIQDDPKQELLCACF